jgi:D-alanyl-D-alanine carboxypeptidase
MHSIFGQFSPNNNVLEKEKLFQAVLDTTVDTKKVMGTSFAIKKDTFFWQGASGNLAIPQPYFIASTTKLFTTAIVLKLIAEGKLGLDDKLSCYLDTSILLGLHIYKGKAFSEALTIKHLLAHTSGLPDYFQGKDGSEKSLEDEITNGHDQYWTFEQAIERAKKMTPLFAPGSKNKAHYSDTNFQLLGSIIETITGQSYSYHCKRNKFSN